MSNHETKKTLNDLQKGVDAITPLTDEQINQVTGGGAAAMTAVCPVGQHWDSASNSCVPDAIAPQQFNIPV